MDALERRLRRDAASWRTEPSPELRTRVLRAIGDPEQAGSGEAMRTARWGRPVGLAASIGAVALTGLIALWFQSPGGALHGGGASLPEFGALRQSVERKAERAEELLIASSLRHEARAIVSDAESMVRLVGLQFRSGGVEGE
jgi:hypothetical protein